jgi:iron complex outermembrane receptor protein
MTNFCIILFCVFSLNSFAERFALPIKGRVINENGEPLIGATVEEKGTVNSTVTTSAGAFSISVANENSVLVISYVGYTAKEVAIQGTGNWL